jgi:hypothetical protein
MPGQLCRTDAEESSFFAEDRDVAESFASGPCGTGKDVSAEGILERDAMTFEERTHRTLECNLRLGCVHANLDFSGLSRNKIALS